MGEHTLVGDICVLLTQLISFFTLMYKNRKNREQIEKKVDENFKKHQETVEQQFSENKDIAMQAAKNAAQAAWSYQEGMNRLSAMFDALRQKEAELQQKQLGENLKDAVSLAKQKDHDLQNVARDTGETVQPDPNRDSRKP